MHFGQVLVKQGPGRTEQGSFGLLQATSCCYQGAKPCAASTLQPQPHIPQSRALVHCSQPCTLHQSAPVALNAFAAGTPACWNPAGSESDN